MPIKLGTRFGRINTGSKRRLSELNDTFQYVPLLKGLQTSKNMLTFVMK